MPDLTAGSRVKALDTPVTQYDAEPADEAAFTSTTYVAGATVCGVAFTAPTTGRVLVIFGGRIENNGTAAGDMTLMSAAVKTGATLDAGTVVSDANDATSLNTVRSATGGETTRLGACAFRVVSGLTPGDVYNAVTKHRVNGTGTGDVFDRNIAVIPLP